MTSTKMARIATIAVILASLATGSARADLINGSFESFTGGHNGDPSQLANPSNNGTGYTNLTGWTVGAGTYGFLMAPGVADTTGSYSPQYNNTFTLWGSHNGGLDVIPTSSPDGGNYVVLDGGQDYRGAGISQTVGGLTVGQAYSVTFSWASGQQEGFTGDTTEQLQVSFGGQSQSTAVVSNVSHGFTDWTTLTYTFTADSTSDTLNFLAIGTPNGLPPMVLLDGVKFGAAVPEPSSILMMGIGVLSLAAARRRRGVKTATA